MKKILLIVLIVVFVLLFSQKNYELTDDMIRFRVIANSNSAKDILMKEKIVNVLSNMLFKNHSDINSTRTDIISNIENIQNKVDKLFEDNDYNMNYNISYGLNEFPEKKYGNYVFEAGVYESLVIEVGDAKGNNYWCILYPPLCMVDDYQNDKEIKYGFKFVEVIKKIF